MYRYQVYPQILVSEKLPKGQQMQLVWQDRSPTQANHRQPLVAIRPESAGAVWTARQLIEQNTQHQSLPAPLPECIFLVPFQAGSLHLQKHARGAAIWAIRLLEGQIAHQE